MRTCRCRRCGETFVIGHPEAEFRKRARDLARESSSLFARLTGKARATARSIEGELIRDYYSADPKHLRDLPPRCPQCQHRGDGTLPWWDPEIGT